MLTRNPHDVEDALSQWERKLRPYVENFQSSATKSRALFTPANRIEKALRSGVIRMSLFPVIGPALWRRLAVKSKGARMSGVDIATA
jgi:2-polyprenyl-6-methoxyphenol hydroxylase-like FAD-dependent oxidoreductase